MSDDLQGNEEPHSHSRILRKVRNEVVLEFAFAFTCFTLAVGLDLQVVLAVVITCLKFAVPDFVTAFLVLKGDPSRGHGIGVGLLFMAAGMVRASQFAFIALVITVAANPILIALGLWRHVAPGIWAGFVCGFGFLATVFLLGLAAVIVARRNKLKLYFARGLTQLRRAPENKKQTVILDIQESNNWISIASGIGLAVFLTSLLFLMPQKGVVLGAGLFLLLFAFILPIPWCFYMFKTIEPSVQ